MSELTDYLRRGCCQPSRERRLTNLQLGSIGIDCNLYGVFIWWPHDYFYTYYKLNGGVTEEEWLTGVQEFCLCES